MNKKRIVALCVAVIFTIGSLFALCAYAADTVRYSYDEKTFTLTVSGTGDMTDYTQNNYSSRPWFVYADATKRVVVENGIKHIGAYSFAKFSELEEVVLPDSVTSIGEMGFGANDKLCEITVGSNVSQIGDFAFGYDSQLSVKSGFVAHCSQKSEAQRFCLKNHIYFDTPITLYSAVTASFTLKNEQALWSFVPAVDGVITFYSEGKEDTCGFLYGADSYAYDTSFTEMRKTALAYNDDSSMSNVNFKFSYRVKAGERYYLSAIHRQFKTGLDITVFASFVCDNHSLVATDFDSVLATLSCRNCRHSEQVEFMAHYAEPYAPLDVNDDGIVNAKDYVMLLYGCERSPRQQK